MRPLVFDILAAMDEPLNANLLEDALAALPGWVLEENKLVKQFKFADFARAMGWMMCAAIEIEKLGHHPEWINVYDRVLVALTTHSAGHRVTVKDVQLAKILDGIGGDVPDDG